MDYYGLKSIIGADKLQFQMLKTSESFYQANKRERPYIQPSFAKDQFKNEKPSVIFISAVGATGKSTLAEVLSNDVNLPLLDLSKHKPVGDNTLTGLITTFYRVEDLSNIFDSLRKGKFGIIIDGIDEARSKTTQKAFEAFLDDIVQLSKGTENASFVILGRTQIVEESWFYLDDKKVSAGLITINPFDLNKAREYLDTFTEGLRGKHPNEYMAARDYILNKIVGAFGDDSKNTNTNFLSFIGYPPVLDAIVTLLNEEQNYQRLLSVIQSPNTNDVEIKLLSQISEYILKREREQKVIPNIIKPLITSIPTLRQNEILSQAYDYEEQCMRLISYCLNINARLDKINERIINDKYEEQLGTFLPEHPFISGKQFRNAVFESLALATLISSNNDKYTKLVLEYFSNHKHSYYLIYLLSIMAKAGFVNINYLDVILGSALEFRSNTAIVELNVEATDSEDLEQNTTFPSSVDIQVEIFLGKSRDNNRTFSFNSDLTSSNILRLNSRLSSTYLSVPCDVVFYNSQEIEFSAPIEIYANKIIFESNTLILRNTQGDQGKHVIFQARKIESSLQNIISGDISIIFMVNDRGNLGYPIIEFVKIIDQPPTDPLLRQKYLRLKRILVEFRSHSRGSLARLKAKIESDRVMRNEIGRSILNKLQKDRIITQSGNFYHLDPDLMSMNLDISYNDLRVNNVSERLMNYLRSI